MMGELFKVHGEFCASHPLEVVVTTVTVIMSLVSMGSTIPVEGGRVCGWNYDCAKAQVKCELHDIIFFYICFEYFNVVGK